LPPHFHAERADEWEVRVRFLRKRSEMKEIVYGRPRQSELKKLLEQAEAHREELLREWEAKVNVKTPGPAS
jgi:hypothetical protein